MQSHDEVMLTPGIVTLDPIPAFLKSVEPTTVSIAPQEFVPPAKPVVPTAQQFAPTTKWFATIPKGFVSLRSSSYLNPRRHLLTCYILHTIYG